VKALEDRLGHRFFDGRYLERALTHASLGVARSNERLEFLGDRVLGLIIAEKLYAEFPDLDEGGLAVRLNALVRREACARVAEAAELPKYLVLASSEESSGGRAKPAILAGACEAVIAALYLDGGMEAVKRFVLRYWEAEFETLAPELRDAKTALQEWAQSGALAHRPQPAYTVRRRVGPDHAPVFTVEVLVEGLDPVAGEGRTKREAEQAAAHALLLKCGVWKE
jgi:ribonuclease-3